MQRKLMLIPKIFYQRLESSKVTFVHTVQRTKRVFFHFFLCPTRRYPPLFVGGVVVVGVVAGNVP